MEFNRTFRKYFLSIAKIRSNPIVKALGDSFLYGLSLRFIELRDLPPNHLPIHAGGIETGRERLQARDYLLLVLVSLLTILLMFIVAELLARRAFEEQIVDTCEYNAGAVGWLFTPNCTSVLKAAEGNWVINVTNSCGYRTKEPCGPKPADGRRVIVMGTSVARGYFVSYETSFAGRSSSILSKQCGRPVDFQNLAMARGYDASGPLWDRLSLRVDEALSLRPDLIAIVLTAFDLAKYTEPSTKLPEGIPDGTLAWISRVGVSVNAGLRALVNNAAHWSRTANMLRHYAFADTTIYLPLYLKHGDEADFLRPPLSSVWRYRASVVDTVLLNVTTKTNPANVPVVLIYVPDRAQAALAKIAGQFAGIDPYAFGQILREVTKRHDVQYLDATSAMSRTEDPAGLYFPVDGHPNDDGHAVLAKALVDHLRARTVPFISCRRE